MIILIPTTKKAALNGFSSINVVTLSTIDGDAVVGNDVVVGDIGDIGFTILTYDILFILLDDDDDDDDDDDKYLLSIISY